MSASSLVDSAISFLQLTAQRLVLRDLLCSLVDDGDQQTFSTRILKATLACIHNVLFHLDAVM